NLLLQLSTCKAERTTVNQCASDILSGDSGNQAYAACASRGYKATQRLEERGSGCARAAYSAGLRGIAQTRSPAHAAAEPGPHLADYRSHPRGLSEVSG